MSNTLMQNPNLSNQQISIPDYAVSIFTAAGWIAVGPDTTSSSPAALPSAFATARSSMSAFDGGAVPFSNASAMAAGGFNYRIPFQAAFAQTDLVVQLVNWLVNSSGVIAGAQTLTCKAAIEYAGAMYPITWANGLRLATLDPWGEIDSKPLGLELAQGDQYWLHLFINGTSGTTFPNGYNLNGNTLLGLAGSYVSGSDQCDTLGAYANSAAGASIRAGCFRAIKARPLTPSGVGRVALGCIGDSIPSGQGDVTSAPDYCAGYLVRGAGLNRSLQLTSISGVTAQTLAAKSGHPRISPVWADWSHAFVSLGANDLTAGRTLAQIQADLTTLWQSLANRGVNVYGVTVTPHTSSTDSWATPGNQTPFSAEAVRVALNTWIRTKPAPLADVFDLADAIEVNSAGVATRNGGIWPGGGSADGLHPGVTTATPAGVACGTFLTGKGI